MKQKFKENNRDSIKDIWGERTPHYKNWKVRVDKQVIEEPDEWIQSACVLCATSVTQN